MILCERGRYSLKLSWYRDVGGTRAYREDVFPGPVCPFYEPSKIKGITRRANEWCTLFERNRLRSIEEADNEREKTLGDCLNDRAELNTCARYIQIILDNNNNNNEIITGTIIIVTVVTTMII